MTFLSRRQFIKQSAIGATGVLSTIYSGRSLSFPRADELSGISRELILTWGQTLLNLQIKDRNDKNYGTIIYPAENVVHGRMGDMVYPFMHLANTTGNSAYLDAAVLLYRWMERSVSQEDGSWLNDLKAGSWKGTTVFSAIALAEAVKRYGAMMDNVLRQEMMSRLKKSGDFIYNNFSIEYGNINYPIAASYGLSLLGELLDVPKFKQKGKELAHQALPFITAKDGLLSGEGGTIHNFSPKGCLSVDLGYNVEESLPSLVLYAQLSNDQEVLDAAIRTMEVHMEFMLPDGGWDNSWGTRNYKWTYWGSRTSDGCQPAYGLMAARNPAFYKVALRNTQQLKTCTHQGLLYGGPHYVSHGLPASLHHTFCHIKALVTMMDHGVSVPATNVTLPREKEYGSRFFSDIQTGLISIGGFRATVTGYDKNYKDFKAGHASGGALSMLWHEEAGVILAASMNEYQLYEAQNMQVDNDPLSMPLTPRIELQEGGKVYMNIADSGANVYFEHKDGAVTVRTTSKLVDKNQEHPQAGAIDCEVIYRFEKNKVMLDFKHNSKDKRPVRIIVPVVSPSSENIMVSEKAVLINRKGRMLKVYTSKAMKVLPTTGKRIFNFVPGLEAIPVCIEENVVRIEILC